MIGLPTETKEDISAIAHLVRKTVDLSRKFGRIQFHISISPFSPKTHTPFQWEKQNTKEELLEKVRILHDEFRSIRQIKFSWRDPKVSEIECILGRGDRNIAKVIYTAWESGTKFDGWSDLFRYVQLVVQSCSVEVKCTIDGAAWDRQGDSALHSAELFSAHGIHSRRERHCPAFISRSLGSSPISPINSHYDHYISITNRRRLRCLIVPAAPNGSPEPAMICSKNRTNNTYD